MFFNPAPNSADALPLMRQPERMRQKQIFCSLPV